MQRFLDVELIITFFLQLIPNPRLNLYPQLRYPEIEFVTVAAKQTYCEPARLFLVDDQQVPLLHDDLLDAENVFG